jgi:hypothetical protein
MSEIKGVLAVTDPADLDRVSGFIHDKEFDVNAQISFDAETKELTINFSRDGIEEAELLRRVVFFRVVQFPIFKSKLVIHRVIRYKVRDGARIQRYTFSEITYSRDNGEIILYCNEDLDIHIHVESVQVDVLDGEAARQRTLWLLPGATLG